MKISDIEVKGITCNSKAVKKSFIFVAIKGNRQDGRCFIKEAIAKGAVIVVVQGRSPAIKIPANIKLIVVRNARNFFSEACAEFYHHPSRNLKVIGITGTNGKTTVSYLVEARMGQSRF